MQLQRRSDRFRSRQIAVAGILFLLWAAAFITVFREAIFPHAIAERQLSPVERQAREDELAAKREAMRVQLAAMLKQKAKRDANAGETHAAAPAQESSPAPSASTKAKSVATLNAGWVTIADPWGHLVTRVRSAVTVGGWLALPARALVAGYRWTLVRDDGRQAEIVAGRWDEGQDVGLWRTPPPAAGGDGLSLAAFRGDIPLGWMSLESEREVTGVRLEPGQRQGDFVVCVIPKGLKEVGVFVQGKAIVGFTFGTWRDGAYLWTGPAEAKLTTNTDPHDFYGRTFAGGREEKIGLALSMRGKSPDAEVFAVLAEAFSLPPKLSPADTPEYLRPEGAVALLRKLCGKLIRSGQGPQVVAALRDQVLLEIGDISLFLDMIPAVTASQGFEAATKKIETVGRELVERGGVDVPAVNELHLRLYREWLQSLLTVKSLDEAADVLARGKAFYPNDPYLHLMAVELALLNNNWREAERLLAMMSYPPELQDRAELLARKIAEMKGDAGRIVIRFPPGSSLIPVSAALNQAVNQKFMVDTGASMVSIPSATAEALNLKVVRGDHWDQHQVSTAGGVVAATEVLIDTLEVEGWAEHNVRALVMDIPDQPGVGLLGLNYLGRFKMDLNTGEGKLTLRPK